MGLRLAPGRPAASLCGMKRMNISEMPVEHARPSPGGRYLSSSRNISIALGHVKDSDSRRQSHPFDVELCSVPPGKSPCPFHLHSAQSEMYIIVSGQGSIRTKEGSGAIAAGDAMYFPAGDAHQISNTGEGDLLFYIIADNPVGESSYYPDSDKWGLPMNVNGPILKNGPSLDYFLGEEG
jgi:mannose-6-phosphate isomerase-like protein (cupin superfamily)